MGGKSSKQREQHYIKYYKALRRGYGAEGTNLDYQVLEEQQPLAGASGTSLAASDKVLRPYSTERDLRHQQDVTLPSEKEQPSDEEEEVGFPVYPTQPVPEATYKDLIDMSHFLKEKGGLEGIWWSKRREEILDLYAQNEWGLIPNWQNYTKGPGIRYPKTFGFLFKLVPVAVSPPLEEDECNRLLNSSQMGIQEDPEGERLMWKFDSGLAYTFYAPIIRPEEYKCVTSLSYEAYKKEEKPDCCKRKWWQF
ncbi:nef protein [Simian immunodeficiency virus]|uniref:Protein Nef n=1 Tax=Simian immunodeficiency virus TaxID=11723 RepID=Q7ZB12_SIV|nr:nef protein [Simian immunodeficiency virus]